MHFFTIFPFFFVFLRIHLLFYIQKYKVDALFVKKNKFLEKILTLCNTFNLIHLTSLYSKLLFITHSHTIKTLTLNFINEKRIEKLILWLNISIQNFIFLFFIKFTKIIRNRNTHVSYHFRGMYKSTKVPKSFSIFFITEIIS